MKITNLGLPSSSILGKEGGGCLWNWRACIPFFPFAWTTNTCFCLCWGCWVVLLEEQSECLTNPSSIVLELDKGSRISAFRDITTSIFHYPQLFLQWNSVCSLYCLGNWEYKSSRLMNVRGNLIHSSPELSQGMEWDTRRFSSHTRGRL